MDIKMNLETPSQLRDLEHTLRSRAQNLQRDLSHTLDRLDRMRPGYRPPQRITQRDLLFVAAGIGLGLALNALLNHGDSLTRSLPGPRTLLRKPMQMAGLGSPSNGITFQKTVLVAAPVEDVFGFWQNFENFPRFMKHVDAVQRTGAGRSHWVAKGPAGVPVEWDAVVTRFEPNRTIAWRSVPGSTVANQGAVHFDPNQLGQTRVTVHMTYNPPAGAAGHAVATLFGDNPEQAMDDDLERFKDIVEHREPLAGLTGTSGSTLGGTPNRQPCGAAGRSGRLRPPAGRASILDGSPSRYYNTALHCLF